jgi:hypothetical protein
MSPTPRDFLGAGLLAAILFALVLVFFLAGMGSV